MTERNQVRLSLAEVRKMFFVDGMPLEFFEKNRKATIVPGVTLEMFIADMVLWHALMIVDGVLVKNRDWESAQKAYSAARSRAEEVSLEVIRALRLPEMHDSHF